MMQPGDDAIESGKPPSHRPRPHEEPPPLPDDDERWRHIRRAGSAADADEDGLSSLIPYRNGWALAAYYTGVFGVICVIGVPLAIAAIIFGILGVKFAKKHPEASGISHANVGIVLGSISLFVHLAAVVFLVFLLPLRQ